MVEARARALALGLLLVLGALVAGCDEDEAVYSVRCIESCLTVQLDCVDGCYEGADEGAGEAGVEEIYDCTDDCLDWHEGCLWSCEK